MYDLVSLWPWISRSHLPVGDFDVNCTVNTKIPITSISYETPSSFVFVHKYITIGEPVTLLKYSKIICSVQVDTTSEKTWSISHVKMGSKGNWGFCIIIHSWIYVKNQGFFRRGNRSTKSTTLVLPHGNSLTRISGKFHENEKKKLARSNGALTLTHSWSDPSKLKWSCDQQSPYPVSYPENI